jgi:type III secretory pathway component EscV
MISDSIQRAPQGGYVALDAQSAQRIIRGIQAEFDRAVAAGKEVVLLTNTQIRLYLRRLTERSLSGLNILSYNEISPDVEVVNAGQVSLERAAQKTRA